MPTVDVVVDCPVYESFRVQQVAGMFDVPLAERSTERFSVELPERDEPWDIGLIVGPSGSGKSTVARRCFPDELYRTSKWPADRAVIDCIGDLPARKVAELLTAVGFSSPPAWIKPHAVLSCGQQFRCDLARALAGKRGCHESDGEAPALVEKKRAAGRPLVVFDEFTSVVDRNVAQACAAAVSKGVRNGSIHRRFIAVTCHYDVAEWLEPDWVLDMATCKLHRRRLRRPAVNVEIYRCGRAPWRLFARHHYLSGSLARGARCYLAVWNNQPITFCATVPVIGKRKHRRFTRIVTLPDYQGMGIGMRVVAAVASLHRQEGFRINVTSSHPAVLRHCKRSPQWKAVGVKRVGSSRTSPGYPGYRSSAGRAVASFEYVGD